MKKSTFKFSVKPARASGKKKLLLENDLLRMQLNACNGSHVRSSVKGIPPEIEHLILKNILEFEESFNRSEIVSVFDYIGCPAYKDEEKMADEEILSALAQLTDLLFSKNITVDFGTLTDDRRKYSFIIEELFDHQIHDVRIAGMFLHFRYNEFNPDTETDMRAKAMEFIADWFERSMGKYSWELAERCTLPDSTIITKEELLEKFRIAFEPYRAFRDCQYLINNVFFELKDGVLTGSGHVEGAAKFNALLKNGEKKTFDGPFKLHMTLENKCWRISYFTFPGFEW